MIAIPSFIWQFLPIFLYAETHYRFRYFFSYLKNNEPEIIADAPHRLDPDTPLPILVIIKDAHKFPVTLNSISVVIHSNGKIIQTQKVLNTSKTITDNYWWNIYYIPLNGLTGSIECDVLFEVKGINKKRFYNNDNHLTSTKRPLKIFVSTSPLPRFKHLHFGECHSHSYYTDDQVEFGAPLLASAQLCRSFGLTFFCATDHSYDMDDALDNYLINDKNLPKWRLFQQEIDDLQEKNKDFVVVRGEEVTCRNSTDQNIHLLLLGNRKFFIGSGDSAEHWLKTYSELSIDDILNDLEPSTLAFAAHPNEPISFIQRSLLHRGNWHMKDFLHHRLSGIQFVNGQLSDSFWNGYRAWIKMLLQGDHLLTIAGNDAHGNFNRFRQIGIPFLKIRETENQLFGKMRTGIFLESLSEENILKSIRLGKIIVTDGPVANLTLDTSDRQITSIGQKLVGANHSISLEILSSTEYGSIDSFKVLMGRIGEMNESEIISEKSPRCFTEIRKFDVTVVKDSYIRAEVWTSAANSNDNKRHFCLTNPIWLSPHS